MMNDKQLNGLLILLVPQIVKEIMEQEALSEDAATAALYRSELYAALEDEKTKLWHLSPKALYHLYRQETETGHMDYPEEA